MPKPKRIGLSIDWDFFVDIPEPDRDNQWCTDWEQSEDWSAGLLNAIWVSRYAGLVTAGCVDQVKLYCFWQNFWEEFDFLPGTTMIVQDSHSVAYAWAKKQRLDEIWSFDAHHDFGYAPLTDVMHGQPSCDNWALRLATDHGITTHVRYPGWKIRAYSDDGLEPEHQGEFGRFLDRSYWDSSGESQYETLPEFCSVFVCRSSPWTPPWFDQQFEAFLQDAHLMRECFGWSPVQVRLFDILAARKLGNEIAASLQSIQNRRQLLKRAG